MYFGAIILHFMRCVTCTFVLVFARRPLFTRGLVASIVFYTQISFKTRVFLVELTSDRRRKLLIMGSVKTRVFILNSV